MKELLSWLTRIPQTVRRYFYGVVAAALPLVAVLDDGFDRKDPADIAAVLGFAAAILAVANVPSDN